MLADASAEGEDVLIEELERVVEVVRPDGLNDACRFGKDTRRRDAVDGRSCARSGGAVVWYVLVVSNPGCIRQPIAAVRRVGVMYSILLTFDLDRCRDGCKVVRGRRNGGGGDLM